MHRHVSRCRKKSPLKNMTTHHGKGQGWRPLSTQTSRSEHSCPTHWYRERRRERNTYTQDVGCKGVPLCALPPQKTVQLPQPHGRGKQKTPVCSLWEEAEVCFQLESEGKEESTTRGASLRAENKKRELLCIAWGRERLPHTEIGADGKGKVCPRSDTEERRERQRDTQEPAHLVLSDTGRRTNREQCSNITQPSWTLLLFKGIFTLNCTPGNPVSAGISLLFHCTVSVILCKLSLAGLSALQCYPFPLQSPHTFSICPPPLVLSRLFLCWLLQSLAHRVV